MSRMLLLCGLASSVAGAQDLSITIENTSPTGGFFFTPVWVAAHDGSFDSYDGGDFASAFPGITEIAEGGDTGPISDRFAASSAGLAGGVQTTVAGTDGPDGAPVYAPGESFSFNLNVGDSTVNRYFSYASMVVPSNDLFFANGNPMAHELFDAGGTFNGPMTIEIYGRDVNDNGTEVNNAFGGAAFSANGGADMDESFVIRDFFTDAGDEGYLMSFVGTDTAIGTTITNAFDGSTLIARITIVPAPASLMLLGGAGLMARRRR